MISIEKAQALKEAGLKHKTTVVGDRFYSEYQECIVMVLGERDMADADVWHPTLAQLLAEVEARGYTELSLSTINKSKKGYVFELLGQGLLPSKVVGSYYYAQYPTFTAAVPEDAAADALLWILKEEKK